MNNPRLLAHNVERLVQQEVDDTEEIPEISSSFPLENSGHMEVGCRSAFTMDFSGDSEPSSSSSDDGVDEVPFADFSRTSSQAIPQQCLPCR